MPSHAQRNFLNRLRLFISLGKGIVILVFFALSCGPSKSEKMHQEGLKLYDSHDYERAKVYFEAAAKEAPDNYIIWKDLGNVYLVGYEDHATALQYYQKSLKIKPNYANARHNIALIHEKEGRLELALKEFQDIIKEFPNFYFSYVEKANILIKQKKISEALKTVEKSLEINANYPQSLYQASLIYYEYQKDYGNAEKFILQTLKNSPQYADALFLASRIYEKINHPGKSLFYMEKYYELVKDSPMEKSLLQNIKNEIGRLQKAKNLKARK